MKKARFSEEQVAGILKQHEADMKTADLCREHNISAATFYAWKAKYGGLEVNEAQELKRLKEENSKLKTGGRRSDVGQRGVERSAVKKLVEPAARRTAVSYTIEQYRISERRACRLAAISRSSRHYQRMPDRDDALRKRLRELARERQRFGHLGLTVLLRREHWVVNHKRFTASAVRSSC